MPPNTDHGVEPLVEHLFRTEAARLTAILTRLLGPEHLALAEDVTQDALLTALRRWRADGIPDNPAAWIVRVARRRAVDVLRREASLAARSPMIAQELDALADRRAHDEAADGDPFADDGLRMVFLCCHPAISPDSRVALTLKIVAGFGVGEIARAFLADESAVAQRLTRAKQALRGARATFDLPAPGDLPVRMDAVLDVLYLMFNEGHTAHEGDELLRRDLCHEALRLTELLLAHEATASPRVHALAALFCLHMARFDARVGDAGEVVRLAEQDRSRWDGTLVARGFRHFGAAASGHEITRYHLEAEIATLHAGAPSWEGTDWSRILDVYDRLLALTRSPVVALNRVVAVWRVHGAATAYRDLESIAGRDALDEYLLYHAVRGELLADGGDATEAVRALHEAARLARSEPLRAALQARATAVAGSNVRSAARHSS